MDEALLSRVEDASLNASAPPQQLWMDGWLLRFSPGKAKRARCINAVANGRLPLGRKLDLASAVFSRAGLPMVVRITPFTQPPDLDAQLQQRGFSLQDDTRVMVCMRLPSSPTASSAALIPGLRRVQLDGSAFAAAVGALRGSSFEHRQAHAQRLAASPVTYTGHAICGHGDADDVVLACGQSAQEAEVVGLYDIFTHPDARGQGLAQLLCEHLLSLAASSGAAVAYLQVESTNDVARRVYERMGFEDAYSYHYRLAPTPAWSEAQPFVQT